MLIFKMTLPINVIIVILSLTSVNRLQAYEIYLQNDTQNFKLGKSIKSDFASLLRNIVMLNKARMGAIQNLSSTDELNYYHNVPISRTKDQGFGAERPKVYVILTPTGSSPVSRGRKKKTKLDLVKKELGKLLKNPTKYLREVDKRNKIKFNDIQKEEANAASEAGEYANEPEKIKDEISRIRNYYKSLNYRKQSAGVDNKNNHTFQSKDDILKSHFHGDLQEKIMTYRTFFSPEERKQLKDASSKQGYKLTDKDIDLLDQLADLFDATDVEDRLPNRQSLRFKIDNPYSKRDKALRINNKINQNNSNNKETVDKNQHHLQLIIKTNGNPISMRTRASDVEAKPSEDILRLLKNAVKHTKQSFKINHLEPLQVQSSIEDYNKHKHKLKHETLKPHRRGQFENRLMKFRRILNEEEKKDFSDLISQHGYTLTDSDFEAFNHIAGMIGDETALTAFINAFNLSDIFDNLRRQDTENLKSKLNNILSLYKPNSEQPFKTHNVAYHEPTKHNVPKMGADYQGEVDNPISKAGFSDEYDESDDQDPVLGDLSSSEDQLLRLKTDDDYDMNDDIDPILGEDFTEDENEKMDLRMYCWSDDTWEHLAFLCGKVCRKTIRDTCATIFCDEEFRNETKSFCKIKCRQKFKRNRLHYSVPNVTEANTGNKKKYNYKRN